MYIDRDRALRHKIAPINFEVERGQLRFFAQTIGLTNPIYFEVDAAKQAGYRDLPVPLTFLSNSIELSLPNPLDWIDAVGGDAERITHAEQAFTYHTMAFANDQLILHRRIVDVYTKKKGSLEFIVKQTDVRRGDQLIAEVLFVSAVRHPEVLA
jgi:hypothetical protein